MPPCQLHYLAFLCVAIGVHTSTQADDWPHWRGPSRDGTTGESSRWDDKKWLQQEPVWKAKVGEGGTSPLVAGGRVYTFGWANEQDRVVCLDAATGRELWTQEYPCPRFGRLAKGDQGLYSGPTSAPEFDVDTGWLYTLSCDGDLIGWDTTKSGQQVWSRNLHDDYNVPQRPRVGRSGHRDYGYTTAPFVHGDWLIVEAGAQEGSVIAFDKRTGKQQWTSQVAEPAGHTGGLTPLTIDGIPCLAVMTFEGLLVIRIDEAHPGETVAQHPWKTDFANSIASVAAQGNSVVITSAYNHNRIARLDISLGDAKLVWSQKHASKVCTPILHDGWVFWCWRDMICLDFTTGDVRWKGSSSGDAGSAILTSDNRLITLTDRGDLRLIDSATRSPGEYRLLAEHPRLFRTDAWPHIAISNGRLFCKDRDGHLVCLQLVDE